MKESLGLVTSKQTLTFSGIEHGASSADWTDSFVKPNLRLEQKQYIHDVKNTKVGKGFMWAGTPPDHSKIIDLREIGSDVKIYIKGKFNKKNDTWYDESTTTQIELRDVRIEEDMLSKGLALCDYLSTNQNNIPFNCRHNDMQQKYITGGMTMIGKHFQINSTKDQYRSTVNTKNPLLWTFVSPFVLCFSSMMTKYMLDLVALFRTLFLENGLLPTGIVGGTEALTDHVIISRNLATHHHKDIKDLSDSVAVWLQDKQTKKIHDWYMVFPNLELQNQRTEAKGVFVPLFHGLMIRWNGRKINHFTSFVNDCKNAGDRYSVFFNASVDLCKERKQNKQKDPLPDDDGICAICYDEFKENEELHQLECPKTHTSHKACWIVQQGT